MADRRVGAALLQPPPPRQDALVDAGRGAQPRSSPSLSAWSGRTTRHRPRRPSPRHVALGKQVFVVRRVRAGVTRSRTRARQATVGPDLDAAEPSAALVAERVRNGQGAMPSFAGTLERRRDRGRRCVRLGRRRADRIGDRASRSPPAGSSSRRASRRRMRPRPSRRSGGCFRSSRGSSTSAGRARPAGFPSATSTSGSAPRTRPATRTPARSSSIPAASPRRRSCSRTATSTSPRRPASSPATTSPRSSRATTTCARWGRSSSGRARRRSSSARNSALRGRRRRRARSRGARPRGPIAMSHGAMPFDLKTTMSESACRPGTSPGDDRVELLHLEPVELTGGDGLDQVARLELCVLDRVAADERRPRDHLRVELARLRIVGADRADERSLSEPVSAEHRILRRRHGDDDVAAARLGRRFGDLGAVLGGKGLRSLCRATRDHDALDRRDCRPDRGELRLRLPAGADQPEARGARSREVLRGDTARCTGPHLAETVGGDHRGERARPRGRTGRRRTRASPSTTV